MAFYITMFVVWILIAVGAILIEMQTQFLIGLGASIAAIPALITHITTSEKWVEFIVFLGAWLVVWIILFFLIKPIHKRIHDAEDGYMAFLNKETIAITGNDEKYGELRFNDKIFRFTSNDKIIAGDHVVVKDIRGVTMIVEKAGGK